MVQLRISELATIAPEQITDEIVFAVDTIESLKIAMSQVKAYILANLMAISVGLDTSAFSKNLDNTITTVQLLANAVDQLAASGGSGDILATLEQRVNNAQAGIGSSGSSDGLLEDRTVQPWSLPVSGTITAGASTFTLTSTGNLINIPAKNTYYLRDAAATASGKYEPIQVNSVAYGSGTVVITVSGTVAKSYAAGALFSNTTGTVVNNSLQPLSAAVSTHETYTVNESIESAEIEEVTGPTIENSYRIGEKWFPVSGMTDANTLTVTSVTGDAAMMPAEYATGLPFKGILFKLDKKGDKYISPKSAALNGKNFIVLAHSGAATGTTTTTIPLTTTNPVYGTAEQSQSFNNDGTTQLKWGYLPLTVLKELSVTDEASFESWAAMTIETLIIKQGTIIPPQTTAAWLCKDPSDLGKDEKGLYGMATIGTVTKTFINGVTFLGGFTASIYLRFSNFVTNNPLALSGTNRKYTLIGYGTFSRNSGYQNMVSIGSDNSQPTIAYAPDNNLSIGYAFTPGTSCSQISAANMLAYEDSLPHLVAGVYDYSDTAGGVWKLWIDAVSKYSSGTNNVTWAGLTGASTIGNHVSNSYPWQGKIGGIIYIKDYAMSSTEISLFYKMVKAFGWKVSEFILRGYVSIAGTGNKLATKTKIYSFNRANSVPSELGSATSATSA